MMGLTQRQIECLSFIKSKVTAGAKCPTFDEIKKELGLQSKASVHRLISGLEDRGYIRRLPGRSRAIDLIDVSQRSSFFQELNPDVKAIVASVASAEGTTPEVVLREWVRERAESLRFVEQRLS